MAKLPMPNRTDVALAWETTRSTATATRHRSFDVKLNYAIKAGTRFRCGSATSVPKSPSCPPTGTGTGAARSAGLHGDRHEHDVQHGANWTHTFSNTFLAEVRGGTSYYHNEALTTANGLKLAQELGIPGVNLDDWSSGASTITINQGSPTR